MNLIDEAYNQALVAIKHCAKPIGFYASGLKGGYEAIWARDSMITTLGASLVRERQILGLAKSAISDYPNINLQSSVVGYRNIGLLRFKHQKSQTLSFKKTFRQSIEALGKNQAWHGAIPNAVGCWNDERKSDITFNSIDSSLWFIIGNFVYARAYNDKTFLKKQRKVINAATKWIEFQDPNNDGLPVQLPTMDWEDIFPHKYGRVLNTQALYFAVLNLIGEKKKANYLKRTINGEIRKTLSLYDKKLGYYLPWLWKYHGTDAKGKMLRESDEWFDTLGNLLAIVTGLATPKIAKNILNYIEKNKINRPYPCKAIWPPLKRGDKEWKWYFETAECKTPYHYSNAGIWPFIGGFYIAALVKVGQYKKAEDELEKLALANKEISPQELSKLKNLKDSLPFRSLGEGWGFQEWLHGKTGKAEGGSSAYQAWSAGMYVYAYECVRLKKIPFFI